MFRTTMIKICVLLLACCTTPLWAADTAAHAHPPTQTNAQAAEKAQNLLQRAVAYYTKNGDESLAAFSPEGQFVDDSYYVYVLNQRGILLVSGGSSAALVGRDVSDIQDVSGKPFLREMITAAKAGTTGQVEYRWLNRIDNKVERKVAYYQRVGDKILAVGFYIPRASPEQAKRLLGEAVKAVATDSAKALIAFNDPSSKFMEDDLYVFVVDIKDGRFLAHGGNRRLVSTDALALRDPNGKEIVADMIRLVKAQQQGEYDYSWKNPVTLRMESKHTFVHKAADYLVGVGYYTE